MLLGHLGYMGYEWLVCFACVSSYMSLMLTDV